VLSLHLARKSLRLTRLLFIRYRPRFERWRK